MKEMFTVQLQYPEDGSVPVGVHAPPPARLDEEWGVNGLVVFAQRCYTVRLLSPWLALDVPSWIDHLIERTRAIAEVPRASGQLLDIIDPHAGLIIEDLTNSQQKGSLSECFTDLRLRQSEGPQSVCDANLLAYTYWLLGRAYTVNTSQAPLFLLDLDALPTGELVITKQNALLTSCTGPDVCGRIVDLNELLEKIGSRFEASGESRD